MLEVRDLHIVRTIQQQGSLARAARVLGMGQPALSRSLAALEARLRGPAFERSRRGVVPTDLGRALLAESAEILERMERLDRHLAEVRGSQAQTLTIIGGAYLIETIAMVAAARMLAAHPATRVRLIAANWAEVPRAVREREASLGLLDLGGLDEGGDLAMQRLRPQPGIFVVRPGHPLTQQAALRLADILSWPFVFIGRIPRRVQEPLAAARDEARRAGQLHPAFPALVHESPTVAMTAVRHSDAVAAVTVPIAASAIRAGELAVLRWREPWVAVQGGVIRPRHRPATEAEDAFLDLLQTAEREALDAALAFLAAAGIDATTA